VHLTEITNDLVFRSEKGKQDACPARQVIIRQSIKEIMVYDAATNTDCLQRPFGIPGISPRKEDSLRQAFLHQGLFEIVQTEEASRLITVPKIGWAYSLGEQAVSFIAPLLTQAVPVVLEKLACCFCLTIAMFQESLGCPPAHGSSADCSLLKMDLEVVAQL
jgi:hypothetical protein